MGLDPMNCLLLYRGCARQPFGLRIRRLNFRECQCVFDISERRRFVIESGALECYIKKDDGSELMVKTVEAGDAFGELALLSARGTGVQENDPLGGAAQKKTCHTKPGTSPPRPVVAPKLAGLRVPYWPFRRKTARQEPSASLQLCHR